MQRFLGHNVLMVGSPGAGKTLLARALPGILPEMSIVLRGFGFHLRARTLAIIAWIAALATLIPIWPALMSFFGS